MTIRPVTIRSAIASALILPALVAVQPVQAGTFADHTAIDIAVAQFTGLPIGVPGGAALPVDRRLRLAACIAPLHLSWRGATRDSVVVQCPVAGGWRIFVGVVAAGRQDVAAPAVTRGEAVSVQATGDGFSVSQQGEALESGAIGSWIRVRTNPKGEAMRAQVVRPGLVTLPVE